MRGALQGAGGGSSPHHRLHFRNVSDMIKFVLILFLLTPGQVTVTVPKAYDTLEACNTADKLAVKWQPGWRYRCERRVFI